jgi:hypothetical protein
MAVITQILLGVFRDKTAPFNPDAGKTGYYMPGSTTAAAPKGKTFNIATIKGIRNVTEGGVTYGSFLYHETDGTPTEEVLVVQASGTIITLCNS